MKNIFLCSKCIDINNKRPASDQSKIMPGVMTVKNINDNGVYKITCANNHTTYYMDTNFKFQNLFLSGCFALIDGYNREAATSFAASLERFYGTVVQCLISRKDIDEVNQENSWKIIKRSSERQLGAFIFYF